MIGRLRSLPMTFVGALIVGLANDWVVGYLPKITTGAQYLSGVRDVTPVAILFLAVLLLRQTKLRGSARQRTREISPTPTWGGSLIFVGIVIVCAIAATPIIGPGDLFSSTKMWGIGIVALSLIPLVGYAGRISLCQLSFAGIGAVVVAHSGANGAPASLLLAAAVAAVIGAIISLPALRLSGIYLALLTAAFAVTLDRWVFQLPAFDSIGKGKKFDLFESGSLSFTRFGIGGFNVNSSKTFFVFGAIVFAIMALIVVAVRRSMFGQRLLALKESPAACETLGMNPRMTTLAVFTLSAGMAGLGGGIYGAALQTATPDTFQFFAGLAILLTVVVGGVSSIGSALFSAIFLGMPITTNLFSGKLTQATSILTGLGGIGLGNNPNGFIAADLRPRFEAVKRYPAIIGGGVALCGILYLLRTQNAVNGWVLVIGMMVIVLAMPSIAEQLDAKKAKVTAGPATVSPDGTTVPLEWLGVDGPVSADDVLVLDRKLQLPEVTGVSA
jgi:branched-chain amino acid transport system permease protein